MCRRATSPTLQSPRDRPTMFKRVRQLRISLAAKCQLLFGAAVVLIIIAALIVPWQRMEQLMEKINERAAASLADSAVNEHVLRETALADARGVEPRRTPTTAPATIDGKT